MNPKQANLIYDILVRLCSAVEGDRESFVFHLTGENPPVEWRFGGVLGFGGKFWANNNRLYVTCYREDETSKRRKVIDRTNDALDALTESWRTEGVQ